VFKVAAFFVAKGFTIGNEKLEVSGIGTIHVGIVNLIDDPMAERKPNAATGMVSGANAFLTAARPARLDSGRSESRHGRLVRNLAHPHETNSANCTPQV
jgi:hypothetical protein